MLLTFAASVFASPHFLLGPTANLQTSSGVHKTAITTQLLSLATDSKSWANLRAGVKESEGALHIREQVFGFMTAAQQQQLATATQAGGLQQESDRNGVSRRLAQVGSSAR